MPAPDYSTDTKPLVLKILDDISGAQVQKYYDKKPGYDAKSQLYKDLGLPADYFSAYVKDINDILRRYPNSGRLTALGMRNCTTIGDFISLFCKAAGAAIPPGEPT